MYSPSVTDAYLEFREGDYRRTMGSRVINLHDGHIKQRPPHPRPLQRLGHFQNEPNLSGVHLLLEGTAVSVMVPGVTRSRYQTHRGSDGTRDWDNIVSLSQHPRRGSLAEQTVASFIDLLRFIRKLENVSGALLRVPRDVFTKIAGKVTFERPRTYLGTAGSGSVVTKIERWGVGTGQGDRTSVPGSVQQARWQCHHPV